MANDFAGPDGKELPSLATTNVRVAHSFVLGVAGMEALFNRVREAAIKVRIWVH